ncbi:hypothetical protein GCM10026987_04110 [Belliella aquatica]|uniref:Uncharacterized protein n=1 Tax=Belliella aquatica TaxID=1323734 RepID=A0ABQ1M9Z9_9BACT|nr:hypothetical protein GCM10010993_15050 [Belliella aquatica]
MHRGDLKDEFGRMKDEKYRTLNVELEKIWGFGCDLDLEENLVRDSSPKGG